MKSSFYIYSYIMMTSHVYIYTNIIVLYVLRRKWFVFSFSIERIRRDQVKIRWRLRKLTAIAYNWLLCWEELTTTRLYNIVSHKKKRRRKRRIKMRYFCALVAYNRTIVRIYCDACDSFVKQHLQYLFDGRSRVKSRLINGKWWNRIINVW